VLVNVRRPASSRLVRPTAVFTSAQAQDIINNPGNYYFNITPSFMAVAWRGQLVKQ
jgi:hypothetical protein